MARFAAVPAAAALAVGVTAVAAPQANASALCNKAHICGYIYNMGTTNVGILNDWNSTRNYTNVLKPGQSSSGIGVYDADGYYAGSHICTRVYYKYQGYWQWVYTTGPGKHKITDNQQIAVRQAASYC